MNQGFAEANAYTKIHTAVINVPSIEYLEANYRQFNSYDISLIDDLRIVRNKIAYDGFFVKESYVERKIGSIQKIIIKLKGIISKKCEIVTSNNIDLKVMNKFDLN